MNDGNKQMERQRKGSRGLEVHRKGGQGPPWAVAPSKKKKKNKKTKELNLCSSGTLCSRVVIPYRCFGTTYWSHFQGPRMPRRMPVTLR